MKEFGFCYGGLKISNKKLVKGLSHTHTVGLYADGYYIEETDLTNITNVAALHRIIAILFGIIANRMFVTKPRKP